MAAVWHLVVRVVGLGFDPVGEDVVKMRCFDCGEEVWVDRANCPLAEMLSGDRHVHVCRQCFERLTLDG
jgi:hypothetical protein